jgi:glutathione synthase/RimK-type ligase-like ATP-grasp enzyme
VILVFGSLGDPHVARVAEFLRRKARDTFVFDHYKRHRFNISLGSDGDESYVTDGAQTIPLSSIDAVWWRVKPQTQEDVNETRSNAMDAFCVREWRSALASLSATLGDRVGWINPPEAHWRARSKILQLQIASRCGFHIPTTRLTNDAVSVARLFGHAGRVIYKAQNPLFLETNRYLFTSEIVEEDVLSDVPGITSAPGIFQSLEPKDHELRVTMVGQKLFAARIDAPAGSEAKIDWRRAHFDKIFAPVTLSDACAEKLHRVHHELGLVYASYDLIVRPDDEVVFLECNPAGQWFWLEEQLGLPISDAVATALAEAHRGEG